METIRIRKAGFSVRMTFEDFYEKYQFLIGRKETDLANQIRVFLERLGFSSSDVQMGNTKVKRILEIIIYLSTSSLIFLSSSYLSLHFFVFLPLPLLLFISFSLLLLPPSPPPLFVFSSSKVFMRDRQKHILQDLLEEKVLSKIILIQRWTRAKLYRCRFLHTKRTALLIQVNTYTYS